MQNRGLATCGIDTTTLTSNDIPTLEIEGIFGPKCLKNGYRYNKKPLVEASTNILELYHYVTSKNKVLNGELNLTFARGVVKWLQGGVSD